MDYFTSAEYAAQHNLTFNPASRHDQITLALDSSESLDTCATSQKARRQRPRGAFRNAYLVETLAAMNPESHPHPQRV